MSDLTVDDLEAEDAKLATLARGAAGRSRRLSGAAVRDGIGRTYASAAVDLVSLELTALQAAVAQAAAAGADTLEAVVIFGTDSESDRGIEAAREMNANVVVYSVNKKDVTRIG